MSRSNTGNVWTDGCYDMVHYGHANQLRQAKMMGERLIVGIHSDEEIMLVKGPTIFNLEERRIVCSSIRWADQVVCSVPYVTTVETLDKYECDFCVHGDDVTTTADGQDTYEEVKNAGRYKDCHRTTTVSSTDLLNRLMGNCEKTIESTINPAEVSLYLDGLIEKFSVDLRPPSLDDTVVYVAGKFDFINPNLINYFCKMKCDKNFLLVGVYSDKTLKQNAQTQTLLNEKERALSLLACKYVNWVVIDAPVSPTPEFLRKYNISKVYQGDIDLEIIENQKCDKTILNGCLKESNIVEFLSSDFIFERVKKDPDSYLTKLKKKIAS